jgi:hypothetical protein
MMDLALQRKLVELEPHQISEIYSQVFETDAGRLVLEDLRNRCFYYVPSFEYPTAAGQTEYNDGRRSVIIHIETQLQPVPVDDKEI